MRIATLVVMFACMGSLPATVSWADKQVAEGPAVPEKPAGGRIVPTYEGGKMVGVKVFAVAPGGRFARIGLANGDLLRTVDGTSVVSDDGMHVLVEKVIPATADVTLELTRAGKPMTLVAKKE